MKCSTCERRCRTNKWWINIQTSLGIVQSLRFCTKACLQHELSSTIIKIHCKHPETTSCRPGVSGCLQSDDIS